MMTEFDLNIDERILAQAEREYENQLRKIKIQEIQDKLSYIDEVMNLGNLQKCELQNYITLKNDYIEKLAVLKLLGN